MSALAVVVLAAGKGKRFGSSKGKLLHLLAGRPLIYYSVEAAKKVRPERLVVVVGRSDREIKKCLSDSSVEFAVQRQPLGTADAAYSTHRLLKAFDGYIVVLNGDVPLVEPGTIKRLYDAVREKRAKIGIVTTVIHDPTDYGRVVRDLDDKVVRVVEERDATSEERGIKEVNTGLYCFEARWLFTSFPQIRPENAQREYYLTDLVHIAIRRGCDVVTVRAASSGEFMNVNTQKDFSEAWKRIRQKVVERLMLKGVSFVDPDSVYVDYDVGIGNGTIVYPNVVIEGRSRIGKNCFIGTGVVLKDTVIGDDVVLKPYSVLDGSVVKRGAKVGPFSRVRPGSQLGEEASVGNFVEIKKSKLGTGVKANHLSYIGDATVGKETNIGCGTITCNYDGKEKHRTKIGNKVFIGSDTQFVAPVRIGDGATIGAGSTITEDVPARSLAIARSRQVNIVGWKRRKRGSSTRKRSSRG